MAEGEGAAVAAVIAGLLGLLLWRYWSDFSTKAHGAAAITMFVFLGLAVVAVARHQGTGRMWRAVYWTIAAAMLTSGVVIGLTSVAGDHRVFWLELVELVLFAAFWTAQTIERWHEETDDESVVLAKSG